MPLAGITPRVRPRGANFLRHWLVLALAGLGFSIGAQPAGAAGGIHKIQHVVVIMQENRSFDSYFGTYPGADGIPMRNGRPTTCSPDPQTGQCVKPFLNHQDLNSGGPHIATSVTADSNGGQMNGF